MPSPYSKLQAECLAFDLFLQLEEDSRRDAHDDPFDWDENPGEYIQITAAGGPR